MWCAALLLQWLLLLQSTGSRVWARQLWHTGLVAPRHVRSSRTRDRTCVPCIARQILYHLSHRGSSQHVLYYKTTDVNFLQGRNINNLRNLHIKEISISVSVRDRKLCITRDSFQGRKQQLTSFPGNLPILPPIPNPFLLPLVEMVFNPVA